MQVLAPRWLIPVAILTSDRLFELDIKNGISSEREQLLTKTIFDLQHCCGTHLRDEDVSLAIQYWFETSTENPVTFSLQKLARIFLAWQGNCFEVKTELLADWLALCNYVDPAWIIATAYDTLFKNTLSVSSITPLIDLQCHLALPKILNPREFADNHVHLNGHGSTSVSLLNFALYLRRRPKGQFLWPTRYEHLLFESEKLDKNNLPIWLNHFANQITNSPNTEFENSENKTVSDILPISAINHIDLVSEPLFKYILDETQEATKRWIIFCLYSLSKTSNSNELKLARLIRCSNIFRSYMVVAGVGLAQFVKHSAFSFRKSNNPNVGLNYKEHSLTNDLHANVSREFRVSPHVVLKNNKLNPKGLSNLAKHLITKGHGLRTHFVVHFTRGFSKGLKKDDRALYSYRDKLLVMVRNFQQFFESGTYAEFNSGNSSHVLDLRKMIRGFDVAGNENQLPIEIFAPSLRILRAGLVSPDQAFASYMRRPFITIHAGEDYSHLLSGLRAVDEAVNFCMLEEGDRLGHALALGVDVKLWAMRQKTIYLTLGEHVDNLAWLFHQSVHIGLLTDKFTACLSLIRQKLIRYSNCLYGKSYEPEVLYEAWLLRRNQIGEMKVDFGSEKQHWQPDHQKISQANSEAVQLWHHYLERANHGDSKHGDIVAIDCDDTDCVYEGRQIQNDNITPLELDLFEAVQDFLIEQYAQKRIVIEVCPTSNVTIGRLTSYKEHPIYRWNPPEPSWLKVGERFNRHGIRKGAIALCINTDDAGLMPTTLENEHRLIEITAVNDLNVPSLHAKYWIDSLRETGHEIFQGNHLNWEVKK
ncbi:MAG: hypothetical protein ACJAS1_004201 [Oleiphilaceae bacterium]|jgi:hypothetical protein